ncbi:MAG TPA: glycerate kinase [Sphaerochaeta sp.]|nr:MAG: glycerate kinase [Spirochaetes bacterium GWC2_52_13]HCS35915.1 glycerate kinase [Sphaerochaeta sp.]
MKKFILIPDSFKGTMSSTEVCSIMETAILVHYPSAQVVSLPVADGGEGSVDSFLTAMGGEKVTVEVTGPYFDRMEGFYGIVDNDTAIIEMAACAGLPLVGDDKRPDQTTTYGVGELMLHAAQRGCKRIVVGLGGSSTNDGGTGAAAAAGVRFLDAQGNTFVPTGGTLSNIASIDMKGRNPLLDGIDIVTMCDIDNPLYGEHGAAYVFGPQKGADEDMVRFLDSQLRSLGSAISRDLSKEVSQLPGAGAAGGMGAGMVAFFDAKLEMGIEVVLDTVGFDKMLEGTDMVFSGEGKIDFQSLRGKVVIGIARRTKRHNVPLVAVVGDIGDSIDAAYDEGVSAIFSINRIARDFKHVKERAPQDMALTMDNLMRFVKRLGL